MTEKRVELTSSGLGDTDEDWWYLVTDDDGSEYVEHQWSYLRLRDFRTDAGTARIEIGNFLANPRSPQRACQRLGELLAARGKTKSE
jgi:hypothetical protein